MDQESFRKLLQTPHAASSSGARSQVVPPREPPPSKAKSAGPAQATFKPRKVKKTEARYRDRAAERRVGSGNDYAQVEAVLEEFERRNVNEEKSRVEEQRRYLGGDSDHSILVKGLDIALLEQNKARTITSTEDESLEQAFAEASAESTVPKKRTREDLIQELKKRKQNGTDEQAVDKAVKSAEEEARLLEEAKKTGKFKPIGFKPIGAQEVKSKKRKVREKEKKGQKQIKKPKIAEAKEDETAPEPKEEVRDGSSSVVSTSKPNVALNSAVTHSVATLPDEDFDIFAGAGDYEGFGDEDDEESDHEVKAQKPDTEHNDTEGDQPTRMKWFATDDPEPKPPRVQTTHPEQDLSKPHRESSPHDEEAQSEQPMRLRPLESSALPSIRDFLAMDEAAGLQGKRKQRKEKRKNKKKSGDDDDD